MVVDINFTNSLTKQSTTGFDYEKDITKSIVELFDPGYITPSFGFTYNRSIIETTRFGIAIHKTFTIKHIQYSHDQETDNVEKFKFETGVSL